ncbi:MAG: hypothetical protein FJ278_14900, partial [Planctomycetes bacterium]|nr:hypothetical protein [Planctomycetota bacterium]
KLSIASPDKWGAVVAAKQISGVPKADATRSEPAPPRPVLRKSPFGPGAPEREWELLTGLLTSHKADPKRNAQLAREAFRPEALLSADDRDPLDVVLRRTAALLTDLRSLANAPRLSAEAEEIEQLKRSCASAAVADVPERKKLFAQACSLRRRIAFSNPLLRFDKIAFLTHYPARYGHMCDQYFGFNARPGGGLYVLESPFDPSPRVRDLLAEATVANGRLKGRKIEGGSFISLDLSYDGRTILFAWTEAEAVPKPVEWRPEWEGQGWPNLAAYGSQASARHWAPQSVYHIFQVNADGTDLRQLTDGPWNDFDPCFLPDGRIAFISERRGGYGRCHGRPVPTYTLHSMKPDGSDITCLSFHETNEWHPSVDGEGMIIYTRWDYVDRDSNEAHHLWVTYPDGRDPRSYHGNYPAHREARPWMEMSLRAVPGSRRIVGVAAAHHGENYGSLILIDTRGDDDRGMSQIRRLTPYCPFPEAEGKGRSPVARQYSTPWPLSEDYHLCIHDPAGQHHGLYLVDSFGNAEHLYTDLQVPCLDPIPLRARPRPPAIPSMTSPAGAGTVAVMNVYDSDQEWPKGTKITALRIVQIFPKTSPNADQPRIGLGSQAVARGVLGTVPVEEDGSAHFEAPVGVALYFQALDERGLAVQTMRSDTYLHPGERLTCQGCHEPKRSAPR